MSGIYLDFAASAPLDDDARSAMLPWLDAANPASAHARGREANGAIEDARREIALLVGGEPAGVIFTSGATEALNLAIFGLDPGVLVTSALEHAAVVEPCRALQMRGRSLRSAAVTARGIVDDEDARAKLEGAELGIFMLVNNELGTVQRLPRSDGALICCDAAQARLVGFAGLAEAADLIAVSAHKIGGPQGVGALYVGPRAHRRLRAVQLGGGQEDGFRSGTPSVASIVGFGVAAKKTRDLGDDVKSRVRELRDRLFVALAPLDAEPNVPLEGTAPGHLNVHLPGVDARALARKLDSVVHLSLGSACTATALEPSRVLRAIGVGNDRARASLRLSLGPETTTSDVDDGSRAIIEAARS